MAKNRHFVAKQLADLRGLKNLNKKYYFFLSNSWHKKARKKVSGRKESSWQKNRPIRAKIGLKMAKNGQKSPFFCQTIGRFEGVKKSKQKTLFFFVKFMA